MKGDINISNIVSHIREVDTISLMCTQIVNKYPFNARGDSLDRDDV